MVPHIETDWIPLPEWAAQISNLVRLEVVNFTFRAVDTIIVIGTFLP